MSTPDSDEVLYGDLAYFHTHPSHLAVVVVLCGLPAPPVENCRVLELGCGTGYNLLAMSQALPHGRFVGFDASARQIEHGQAIARTIGNDRVELHVGLLQSFDPELGLFDYIIAHGVFSWVPAEVRTALLNAVRRHLAPQGIAYISYNTYPGWHSRKLARDVMQFLAPPDATPTERVRIAKEAAVQLLEALPEKDNLYAQVLRHELTDVNSQPDYYILHEHLAVVNHPMLFTEFAQLATSHGLQFVAESRYGTNTFAQSHADREVLNAVGDDLIRREQYHDFLWQRYFRQSLLYHAETTVTHLPDPAAVRQFWVHTRVELIEPTADITTTEFDPVCREEDSEILHVSDPLYRLMLRRLHNAMPQLLQGEAFHPDVVETFGLDMGNGHVLPVLSTALLRGYVEGLWHFYTHHPHFATDPGESPLACPLVREQAATSLEVTNRLHRTAKLITYERAVLRYLDGNTTRDEIADKLQMTREHVDRCVARLAILGVLAE